MSNKIRNGKRILKAHGRPNSMYTTKFIENKRTNNNTHRNRQWPNKKLSQDKTQDKETISNIR